MRILFCLLVVIGPAVLADAPRAGYKESAGPFAVDTLDIDWKDGKRDREVPVRLYFPKSGSEALPVVLFSHGLGGSREGYGYLGKHWASHGYVCVHLQHRGSDDTVWKGKANALVELRKAVKVPANAIARPLDVRFVLDELAKMNREGKLKGRLDLDRIGLAGHSFGAYTVLVCAGQTFFTKLGTTARLAEPRIKAAIAMSPQAQSGKGDLDRAFAQVKIPIFHMTGTKDDGVAITETKPADRRVPYDHIKSANQYLLIFADGDHMVFSGARRPGGGKGEKDPRFHALICAGSTAFWDAHLRCDATAKTWLTGEFAKVLGKDGAFERK